MSEGVNLNDLRLDELSVQLSSSDFDLFHVFSLRLKFMGADSSDPFRPRVEGVAWISLSVRGGTPARPLTAQRHAGEKRRRDLRGWAEKEGRRAEAILKGPKGEGVER